MPGQAFARALYEEEADDPEGGDQHDVGCEPRDDERSGQLGAGRDDREYGDDDEGLEHEHQ
jgi:hypothetical protein